MLTLQILNTDITYQLPGTDEPGWIAKEQQVKQRVKSWFPETEVLIIETGEVLTVEDIFGR